MHPEVVSDTPGRCPKCGMNLVLRGETSQLSDDKGLGPLTWKSYLPLMVIIALIAVVACITSQTWLEFIEYFMAGFFVVFAGFKLIDLPGFAHGYFSYDLLAQRVMAYGYVYPFIELVFGLSMLAGFMPEWLLWTEFGVMTFSGLGVAIKLVKREEFQCVCLGTVLKVPLTYVTLIEDFGMAILALILIVLQ